MAYYDRKSPRMSNYDYSTENYYFITICTQERRCMFGSVNKLNEMGIIAKQQIEEISSHYECVHVDKYVIMPNHIHLILCLGKNNSHHADQIIAQYKSGVTREVRKKYPNINIWQRSFHDHVIRNQHDYERIWFYIETNPQRWDRDCFYVEQSMEESW